MRKNKLLTYGVLAGVGYLLYKHMQSTAAPAVIVPAAAPVPVAGFGRLGYYPSGADRPFAHMSMPGAGQPFARANHNIRWWT
jgi:hypothetical protein